jgi:hypothetical protein
LGYCRLRTSELSRGKIAKTWLTVSTLVVWLGCTHRGEEIQIPGSLYKTKEFPALLLPVGIDSVKSDLTRAHIPDHVVQVVSDRFTPLLGKTLTPSIVARALCDLCLTDEKRLAVQDRQRYIAPIIDVLSAYTTHNKRTGKVSLLIRGFYYSYMASFFSRQDQNTGR